MKDCVYPDSTDPCSCGAFVRQFAVAGSGVCVCDVHKQACHIQSWLQAVSPCKGFNSWNSQLFDSPGGVETSRAWIVRFPPHLLA